MDAHTFEVMNNLRWHVKILRQDLLGAKPHADILARVDENLCEYLDQLYDIHERGDGGIGGMGGDGWRWWHGGKGFAHGKGKGKGKGKHKGKGRDGKGFANGKGKGKD